mmetsp:Transcript_174591/g.559744  ORF Transcript_174591/g.559744 Transcript_174591/m.559744 type:complete len:102 (-) Transcript_174591:573-878(-)
MVQGGASPRRSLALLLIAAGLSAPLLAEPPPLLDPALVTGNQFLEWEGRLLRARGLRTRPTGEDGEGFGVHVDLYDDEGRLLAEEDTAPELLFSLQEPREK